MTTAPRRRTETDDDMERLLESSERVPWRGALVAVLGAAGIICIRLLAGETLTVLDYLAAAIIASATAPALLAIALRVRQRERMWVKYVRQLRARIRELLRWESRAQELEEWMARLPARYQLPARPRSGSFRALPGPKTRRALPPAHDEDEDSEDSEDLTS